MANAAPILSRQSAYHFGGFAARQRLVNGQVKVAETSNKIVAIPALLERMAIEDAIVTSSLAVSAKSLRKS